MLKAVAFFDITLSVLYHKIGFQLLTKLSKFLLNFKLMMEQPETGKRHGNAVFIAGFNNIVVTDAAACLSDIFNAAALCAFDIVAEREECVAAERYAFKLRNPGFFLLAG